MRAAALVHGHRKERVFGWLTTDSERAYIALALEEHGRVDLSRAAVVTK